MNGSANLQWYIFMKNRKRLIKGTYSMNCRPFHFNIREKSTIKFHLDKNEVISLSKPFFKKRGVWLMFFFEVYNFFRKWSFPAHCKFSLLSTVWAEFKELLDLGSHMIHIMAGFPARGCLPLQHCMSHKTLLADWVGLPLGYNSARCYRNSVKCKHNFNYLV